MPEIIRLGDSTSHGGKVIEGSPFDICMGKPIAYIGHKVQCPKCKGLFPIVEGAPTTTFYGKGVALAGMHTACGAVLIASQFTDVSSMAAVRQQQTMPPPVRVRALPVLLRQLPAAPPQRSMTLPKTSSTKDSFCGTQIQGSQLRSRSMQSGVNPVT